MRRRDATVTVTSLPRCAFDTALPSGIAIPGFDGALPDAVFVRSISAGTLEQITFRLGILHALRESGVRVWNDARAIERCVDKSMTTFLLHQAGIPTPRTRTMEGSEPAIAYTQDAERQLIFKPLFGSQGKGLLRVADASDLPVKKQQCRGTQPDEHAAKQRGKRSEMFHTQPPGVQLLMKRAQCLRTLIVHVTTILPNSNIVN